jgi:hypothetical protein
VPESAGLSRADGSESRTALCDPPHETIIPEASKLATSAPAACRPEGQPGEGPRSLAHAQGKQRPPVRAEEGSATTRLRVTADTKGGLRQAADSADADSHTSGWEDGC